MARHSPRDVLMLMKPSDRCITIVSALLLLLEHGKICSFHDQQVINDRVGFWHSLRFAHWFM